MIGPIPATLNAWESTAKGAGGISLAIAKHAFRLCVTCDDGVYVIRPDVDSVSDPVAVRAYASNGVQGNAPGFRI